MSQITEDYVSLEIAKLLKEKGFWENCPFSLSKLDEKTGEAETVRCPTIQMVMKWLEEKYGVFCVIRRHRNKDDGFTYSWNCEGKIGLSVGNGGGFKTAVGACEAAIKYCLENLI